ncbi:ECF subfamily RNA polymerase sigma-24 subunit [Seminavis robusta]|uniref:ECF subfamily RNA polymerase sigma-24 subunit n=1 Tax=Seminavis robusta TaxID=568900 RepID=A0A9N8HCY7_9STRA|nr:ECF subfamily RNA polymerase sigma-24 subunit [Seminavis robusta]|eukprot:Sro402_g135400.1 ECF subfamily RNA polymerase sigma-24 subunit (1443) ;mRNA; f:14260-18858
MTPAPTTDCPETCDCFECTSITFNPDDGTKTVCITQSCKDSPISWMCCTEPGCEVQDCVGGGSPDRQKCEGVDEFCVTVDEDVETISVQAHDGQFGGNEEVDSDSCGGGGGGNGNSNGNGNNGNSNGNSNGRGPINRQGSRCGTTGVCNSEVDLGQCPGTQPMPSFSPSSMPNLLISSQPTLDGPTLAPTSGECPESCDCMECTSLTENEDGTLTVCISQSCKDEAISWMCCIGAYPFDGCTVDDCRGGEGPDGPKCDEVTEFCMIVPGNTEGVSIQAHDGQFGGNEDKNSLCGGPGSGSSCPGVTGICSTDVRLDGCPSLPTAPTAIQPSAVPSAPIAMQPSAVPSALISSEPTIGGTTLAPSYGDCPETCNCFECTSITFNPDDGTKTVCITQSCKDSPISWMCCTEPGCEVQDCVGGGSPDRQKCEGVDEFCVTVDDDVETVSVQAHDGQFGGNEDVNRDSCGGGQGGGPGSSCQTSGVCNSDVDLGLCPGTQPMPSFSPSLRPTLLPSSIPSSMPSSQPTAGGTTLAPSYGECPETCNCFECTSITFNPDEGTKTVCITQSCKDSPISWMCCTEPGCEVQDCVGGGSPDRQKCEGVDEFCVTVDEDVETISVQAHDGQFGGNEEVDSDSCGGGGGSNGNSNGNSNRRGPINRQGSRCGTSGVCNSEVDLGQCPGTQPMPSFSPSLRPTLPALLSSIPSSLPSSPPTADGTMIPSSLPSSKPTAVGTTIPSSLPTSQPSAGETTLAPSSGQCPETCNCFGCTSINFNPDVGTKTICITQSCKDSPISWMCCTEPGCEVQDCVGGGSPDRQKCEGVDEFCVTVDEDVETVRVQAHDGQFGGNEDVNRDSCGEGQGGGPGSSCGTTGVCNSEVDLDGCPVATIQPIPSALPSLMPTLGPSSIDGGDFVCSRPSDCAGTSCQFQCNAPLGYYPDPSDCQAYCYCTGGEQPSRWEQVISGLVWDPYCGGSQPLDEENVPLGGMTGGCANWPDGVNLDHCDLVLPPPPAEPSAAPSISDPLEGCSPVETCGDDSVLMCIYLPDDQFYTECVPIDSVQAVLDHDPRDTCGECPPLPPTVAPTIGFSCEGNRCAENDFVYVCQDRETFCVSQEDAEGLLLDSSASCGPCSIFDCDLSHFACDNDSVEICHVQSDSLNSLCVTTNALSGFQGGCDYCGQCQSELPPDCEGADDETPVPSADQSTTVAPSTLAPTTQIPTTMSSTTEAPTTATTTTEPTSAAPTVPPSKGATSEPTLQPSSQPSVQPTMTTATPVPTTQQPSNQPTQRPTIGSTPEPTNLPTAQPTVQATPEPTNLPTAQPTELATPEPTLQPTEQPTPEPTPLPTEEPTDDPTPVPTNDPTDEPTDAPTQQPTGEPTENPTPEPTDEPTQEPTDEPTDEPTQEPTDDPTPEPTDEPTESPADDEVRSIHQLQNYAKRPIKLAAGLVP